MEEKFCRLCQTQKRLQDFAWKSKVNNKKQSYCKDCQNIRSKDHYKKNRELYLVKAKKRNKIVLGQIQEYVWQYLSAHPCIDCGESDIVVLEFDHQGDKRYTLSEIIKGRSSLMRVKKEIEKCTVRCANCHRKKTAKDFGWKKAKFSKLPL